MRALRISRFLTWEAQQVDLRLIRARLDRLARLRVSRDRAISRALAARLPEPLRFVGRARAFEQ